MRARHALAVLMSCLLAAAMLWGAALPTYAAAGTAQELLNGAKLKSRASGHTGLDALVSKTVDKATNDDMDTYQKVKACYDRLVKKMTYGQPWDHLDDKVGGETCGDIYFFTGEIEGLAALALKGNVGFCNGYSAAFMAMCREIGLDAYVAFGDIRASGGGYTDHKWVEVDIGGKTYVFDPQMEQQSVSWTGSNSYFFCTTYDRDPDMYRFSHRQGFASDK